MKYVSIIMNCKNGSRFLKPAINSILNQTYKNWELVFWDNNSIDTSKKIIEFFDDSRIKYYFSNGENSLSKNRNDAILQSKGDLICFLDTDDLWLPNHLESLVELFDDEIKFAYSESLLLKNFKKKEVYKNIYIHKFKFLNNLTFFALNRSIFFGSILIEKNLLKSLLPLPFNLNHSIDDYIILSLLNIDFQKIAYSQNQTFIYRIHSTNLTNFQKKLSAKESIDVLKLIEKDQKIKIDSIVFKERHYKLILTTFFDKNILSTFKSVFMQNIFIFSYFFLSTFIKKIRRKIGKVKNKKEILEYINEIEI